MARCRVHVLPLLFAILIGIGGINLTRAQMSIPPTPFEDVIRKAEADGTPILLEIYAPWCPYCQKMQKTVYADSSVESYLSSTFTYARLNRDKKQGQHQYESRTFTTQELAAAFGARGVPTTVFLASDGTPIARQPGFIKKETFLKMLRYVGSGAYKKKSFRAFSGASSE